MQFFLLFGEYKQYGVMPIDMPPMITAKQSFSRTVAPATILLPSKVQLIGKNHMGMGVRGSSSIPSRHRTFAGVANAVALV
jgi:hypothetical protein